ncbi:MAG: hypothetical protein MI748_17695 [Opitutales bacterium]|nr:hypothetical protein [Opitutales bacterium]
MKLKKLPQSYCVRTVSLAALCAFCHTFLNAQDDDLGDDVYELSPFVVDSSDTDGYLTKSTTAGTRLRTDVKDLGAQIDIFSQDFLDDIAASDPEEAFLYSLNVENEMENPNYGNGTRAQFERDGPATVSRGIGDGRGTGSTNARNFFETKIRTHGYNLETLAISSGPNSILFGLGQAGATINSTLKRADLSRNFGSIGTKFDNHGTKAYNLDLNRILIEDKLALRFAMLDSDKQSYMQGSYDKQYRMYGALTYKINDKINIRVHYEDIDEVEAPTQYRQFQDNISPFLRDGGGVFYDPADGGRPRWMSNASGREALLVDASGNLDIDTVGITKWNNSFGARSDEGHDYIEWASLNGITDSYAYDPNFVRALDDKRVTFSPESLDLFNLPFRTVNPWGDTMRRTRDAKILTAFVEVNPFKDFYVEFAYNDEELEAFQFGYNRSFNYGVFIDTQKFLPNGDPNPNAGNLFMQDDGWGWATPKTEKEFRATATYEYDFRERNSFSDRVKDFLGTHRFAYLYSQRRSTEIRANSFHLWGQNSDGSTPSFLAGRAAQVGDPRSRWAVNGDRRVSLRQYLLPQNGYQLQVVPGFEPGNALSSIPDPGGTGDLRALHWSEETGAHRLFPFDRDITSNMIAYQGYLWGDRLILTYGRRVDALKERQLEGGEFNALAFSSAEWANGEVPTYVPPGTQNGQGPWYTSLDWEDEYGPSNDNTNTNYGVVFRPIGIADWLTFHYNEATNNNAGSVRFDVDGEPHDPLSGEGKDYGFRLDLLNDRLIFKYNRYETSVVGTLANNADRGLRGKFREQEERFFEVDPDNFVLDGFDSFSGQRDLYLPVMNLKSEGDEFTITALPAKGWNIRFTAAKTESVQSDIATSYVEWGKQRASFWSTVRWHEQDLDGTFKPVVEWRPDPVTGDIPTREELIAGGFTRIDPATGALEMDPSTGEVVVYRTRLGAVGDTPLSGWENVAINDNAANPETMKEHYDNEIVSGSFGIIEQLNGISNPNVRKWRANLTTSYQFQQGRLKGLRIGASARYRDKGVTGFAAKQVDGLDVLDISKPYYNESEIFVDAMVAYRGTLRDGKYNYRVQLNVRNLFDNSDLYVTDSASSGRPVTWAGYETRTWILSTNLEF